MVSDALPKLATTTKFPLVTHRIIDGIMRAR
jgi:membrane protein DedA with SNARE-associated domain